MPHKITAANVTGRLHDLYWYVSSDLTKSLSIKIGTLIMYYVVTINGAQHHFPISQLDAAIEKYNEI